MRLLIDAWRDLRAHPGKAVMTALSLFIAVLALVGVTVEGTISRTSVIARDEQIAGRAITQSAYVTTANLPPTKVAALRRSLDHRIGAQLGGSWTSYLDLQSSVEVAAAGAASSGRAPASPTHVYLVDGDIAGVRRLPVLAGRTIGPDESPLPGVVMVNSAASAMLGGVGSLVDLRPVGRAGAPMRFPIVGVVDDGALGPTLYAQHTAWEHLDPSLAGGAAVEFLTHSADADELGLQSAMAAAFADAVVSTEDTITRRDGARNFEFSRRSVERAFLAATLITLIVAIVGMTNIGLSSVRERTREYAVRRACGFTQSRVVGLVLVMSALMGALASLAALLTAYLATRGIVPGFQYSHLVGRPPFPWGAGLVAIAIGMAASLVGSLAPAAAVTRVDIATLLR